MKEYKIINARLTPNGTPMEIYIKNGLIEKIDNEIKYNTETYDAKENVIVPGLIDMNCTSGEPGYEYKEDFISLANAAAAGGYTTLTCQPNVKPVADNKAVIEYIISKSKQNTKINLFPYGSMTIEMEGKMLAEIGEMYADGIVAVSDGGISIADSSLLRAIMIYSKMFKIPVITSCCDKSLAADGVINEGYVSTLCGLKGIPREAEDVIVGRNILLAKTSKAKLHITQVSTEDAVSQIRHAKAAGVDVTCDTCPQYFALTEYAALDYNTFAKIKPPLRTHRDIAAVLEGLRDGTIDAISSGHSPTTVENKLVEFDAAEYGISALETVFAISFSELVEKGVLSFQELISKLSTNPARILGLKERGMLRKGYKGEVAIFDIESKYRIKGEHFKSKAKFTPFENREVKGKAVKTFI